MLVGLYPYRTRISVFVGTPSVPSVGEISPRVGGLAREHAAAREGEIATVAIERATRVDAVTSWRMWLGIASTVPSRTVVHPPHDSRRHEHGSSIARIDAAPARIAASRGAHASHPLHGVMAPPTPNALGRVPRKQPEDPAVGGYRLHAARPSPSAAGVAACYRRNVQIELWTNLPDVSTSTVRRLRREDYDRLVEQGVFDREKVELIRGVIVRMSPQGAPHAGPIELLTEILVPALLGRARVRVQLPLIGPDDSEPEPDIAVVAKADHTKEHPAAAHLVVEVARTSASYDRGTKGPLYAEMGVPEYWIVDVVNRVVEVYREPRGDRYERMEAHRKGATITLAEFPDVSVSVEAIVP